MSIIYEALKKVEVSQSKGVNGLEPAAPKKRQQAKTGFRLYLLLFLLIFSSVLLAGNSFFRFLPRAGKNASLPPETLQAALNSAAPQPQPAALAVTAPSEPAPPASGAPQPPVPEAKEEPEISFVLNGIFFSDGEGYALINNQIAKEGDVVEGAKVKRISEDQVELEKSGETVKLDTAK